MTGRPADGNRDGAAMKLVRILLPINQQGTTEACRQTAFGLAQRLGVRLEALHLCAAPWQRLAYSTELGPLYSQEMIDIGREQVSLEQGEARKWFDHASQAHPRVGADFVSLEGLVTPTIASRARVADVSVVPSIGAKDDVFWGDVRDGALFQSGRPMLAVPVGAPVHFGETLVVAWKDGVEAVRAVTAAAPFFATAKCICLVTVAEGDQVDQSMAAMADYLTGAGLKVEASKIVPKADNVGEALLLEAASKAGSLLVMGAYGHWRWREWAFGGVTEHVLRNATMPVLMAH
jgi:nucleotide-binding universal stress UspA family protein